MKPDKIVFRFLLTRLIQDEPKKISEIWSILLDLKRSEMLKAFLQDRDGRMSVWRNRDVLYSDYDADEWMETR